MASQENSPRIHHSPFTGSQVKQLRPLGNLTNDPSSVNHIVNRCLKSGQFNVFLGACDKATKKFAIQHDGK